MKKKTKRTKKAPKKKIRKKRKNSDEENFLTDEDTKELSKIVRESLTFD